MALRTKVRRRDPAEEAKEAKDMREPWWREEWGSVGFGGGKMWSRKRMVEKKTIEELLGR